MLFFHRIMLLALPVLSGLYLASTVMKKHAYQLVPSVWRYYHHNPNGAGNILVHHVISCDKLFRGNLLGQRVALDITKQWQYSPFTSDQYVKWTANCRRFVSDRNYIVSVSDKERNFPIAFGILVYKDVEQFERLLRAIYRPSNVYCIHVDTKSTDEFKKAVSRIVDCFDNVFLSSASFEVIWGTLTVLLPEIVCIQDLFKYKWKYYINLTGQEFPLKTNHELVEILMAYNGANDIQYDPNVDDKRMRWEKAGKPPDGLVPKKGSIHMIASRDFLEHAFSSAAVNRFMNWLKNTSIPDETFFSTLNHSPQLGLPGTYKYTVTENSTKVFLARFKMWQTESNLKNIQCYGKYVRDICIYGIGDLPKLEGRKELFANKFHQGFEPLAYDCVEEQYFRKVKEEMEGTRHINASFYASLDFVINQIKSNRTTTELENRTLYFY